MAVKRNLITNNAYFAILGIALVGMAFYSPYAAVKAGIAHFGEALRRELDGEGVRVLTVYPTATETPMMATSGSLNCRTRC